MEIDKIDAKDGRVYRLKKIDEIQEILIAERDKRNALSTSYNKEVKWCVTDRNRWKRAVSWTGKR